VKVKDCKGLRTTLPKSSRIDWTVVISVGGRTDQLATAQPGGQKSAGTDGWVGFMSGRQGLAAVL
jgi:hypothetical protein